jgi:hypothetical protein
MTIVLVALIVVTAQASTPASLPGNACTPAALVGTWKVVEASQGGETIPTGPTDPVEYKHVTPTHFIVFQVAAGGTNSLTWAHGGVYTLAGGTYTEHVQHGFGQPFPVLGGKSFAFQCTMEGDDTWHISGDVAGTPIVETWKRVSADRKTP